MDIVLCMTISLIKVIVLFNFPYQCYFSTYFIIFEDDMLKSHYNFSFLKFSQILLGVLYT